MTARLEAIGRWLVLALPVAIMATRAGADAVISAIGALFLLWCWRTRCWGWTRHAAVVVSAAWWGWVMICSLPFVGQGGVRSLAQAVLMGRYLLFVAALWVWVLRDAATRRRLILVLAAMAGWIILECWQQYLLGSNIMGDPRWMDGALTGPFQAPRAGPELVIILFPVVLPVTVWLLRERRLAWRALGVGWFGAGVLTMVLIGQRMPALLTGLGLVLCSLVLPALRRVALAAIVAAGVLVAATPVLSPPTFHKLVVHFSQQMRHFPESDYGQLYIRATVMGLDNPWTGLGFDGFRDHCHDARYEHGLPWLGIPDGAAQSPGACNIHPHNHYMEALTEAGFPGLLLFAASVLAWLGTMARGLGRDDPVLAACFIGTVLAFWPLASTSALFTLPIAGWIFLVLGMGLVPDLRLSVGVDEGADAAFGEHLEQAGVGLAAVEDDGALDAAAHRVEAVFDFRDHAAGDGAIGDGAACLGQGEIRDQGFVGIEHAGHVGQHQEAFGIERAGDGAGDGIGVYVVGVSVGAEADWRDNGNEPGAG